MLPTIIFGLAIICSYATIKNLILAIVYRDKLTDTEQNKEESWILGFAIASTALWSILYYLNN